MKRRPRWNRRIEIALWIIGLSLLGFAAGATLSRWNYQSQQERALLEGAPASSSSPETGVPPQTVATAVPEQEKQAVPQTAAAAPSPGPVTPAADRVAPAERKSHRDPGAVGLIEIPRLGIKAVFREGADARTLSRAVGLVPGSAHPGQRGNMVLAGHRDTFFHDLEDIQVFDRIRIVVPPKTYVYRVESLRVVTPEETDVLKSKGVEELTLVTCYPFRFIGPAPDRYIVNAVRVN